MLDRRHFLHPRSLARSAGGVLDALDDLTTSPSEAPPAEVLLLRATRRAMATRFEVLLPYGTPAAMDIAATAFDEIDRLEQQLTVYRTTSEVSRLNQLAFQVAVPVEERLFELLALAARIHEETEGAFDITAGALIKAWGFYRGPRRVPAASELEAARECTGMQHVVRDPAASTVHYVRPGLEINLGSIGKGYALDRAAELLRDDWQMPAALLHGGHSSVYAIGAQPGDSRGWPVGVRHPWEHARRLAIVWLRDRSLGTSAATFQHLEYNGRKLGHILDPRTGWPAEGIASATAVARSAAEADALATAFFILGVEKTRAYCEAHPGVGAILLPQEAGAVPVVFGLSPKECALCGV